MDARGNIVVVASSNPKVMFVTQQPIINNHLAYIIPVNNLEIAKNCWFNLHKNQSGNHDNLRIRTEYVKYNNSTWIPAAILNLEIPLVNRNVPLIAPLGLVFQTPDMDYIKTPTNVYIYDAYNIKAAFTNGTPIVYKSIINKYFNKHFDKQTLTPVFAKSANPSINYMMPSGNFVQIDEVQMLYIDLCIECIRMATYINTQISPIYAVPSMELEKYYDILKKLNNLGITMNKYVTSCSLDLFKDLTIADRMEFLEIDKYRQQLTYLYGISK